MFTLSSCTIVCTYVCVYTHTYVHSWCVLYVVCTVHRGKSCDIFGKFYYQLCTQFTRCVRTYVLEYVCAVKHHPAPQHTNQAYVHVCKPTPALLSPSVHMYLTLYTTHTYTHTYIRVRTCVHTYCTSRLTHHVHTHMYVRTSGNAVCIKLCTFYVWPYMMCPWIFYVIVVH